MLIVIATTLEMVRQRELLLSHSSIFCANSTDPMKSSTCALGAQTIDAEFDALLYCMPAEGSMYFLDKARAVIVDAAAPSFCLQHPC